MTVSTWRRAIPLPMLLLATSLHAGARTESHCISTEVGGARVSMSIPRATGADRKVLLAVAVQPNAGQAAPSRIRTRIGMPEHGHWVGGEQTHAHGVTAVQHPGTLPMDGRYRLRVWLQYPDGRTVRTGADFVLTADRLGAPVAAP